MNPSNQAEAIFQQINDSISAHLPEGVSLIQPTCVTFIRQKLDQGVTGKDLVDQFLQAINTTPLLYLSLPSQGAGSGIGSGTPRSSSLSSGAERP